MKVLDLQCRQGHSFEGWFGSQDDYDDQRGRGLVTCPVCNDSEIVKMLSAPRLNLGHGTPPLSPASPASATPAVPSGTAQAPTALDSIAAGGADGNVQQQMQAALLNMVRHVMAHTEDVGHRFAEEARKIHHGECEVRSIRGQATREETEALLDEGIDVLPLPLPDHLKGPLQ